MYIHNFQFNHFKVDFLKFIIVSKVLKFLEFLFCDFNIWYLVNFKPFKFIWSVFCKQELEINATFLAICEGVWSWKVFFDAQDLCNNVLLAETNPYEYVFHGCFKEGFIYPLFDLGAPQNHSFDIIKLGGLLP